MHVREILRRPLITEKATDQGDYYNQYSFEVDRRANKHLIKDAVETCFDVSVLKVRIVNVPAQIGRRGRRVVIQKPTWKKAIVTLKQGDRITWVEGV